MSEVDKEFVVGWLEHPERVTPERVEDILQSLGALARGDRAWLIAAFKDARYTLDSRKKLAGLLLGPIREEINQALSKPL